MNTNESPIEKLMQSLMPNADDEERKVAGENFEIYLDVVEQVYSRLEQEGHTET